MALGASSGSISLSSAAFHRSTFINSFSIKHLVGKLAAPANDTRKLAVFAAVLPSKARFIARRRETVSVRQLERPLIEYMRLPASQYSVLDAERIERVDDNTFRCYVYRFKFFSFEICPVLLVRVEEQVDGCSIKLLSCKLEGSPIIVAQNEKFDGKDGYLIKQIITKRGK